MSSNEASATEAIRKAMFARNRKNGAISALARDIGAQSLALENFALNPTAKLAPEILSKIVEVIWQGHFRFRPETDTLESTNTAKPTTIGSQAILPPLVRGPARPGGGPPPPEDTPKSTYKRPGWLR